MTIYEQIATKIIKEQEGLMGSVAWYQARKVKGLGVVSEQSGEVSIEAGNDSKAVINDLIDKYGSLFGRAARQVCQEAVTALIADLPPSDIPTSLQ